jgi:hypothetical protein
LTMHVLLLTLAVLTAGPDKARPDAAKPEATKHEGPRRDQGSATVDWQEQVLKATGSGAPDMRSLSPAQARLGAENAAKLDALRNLLAQAKGIRISADRTVGDAMAQDEVKGRVEGAVKGFRIVKRRYYSDQGVEMDVEVPLSGIAQAVHTTEEPASSAIAGKAGTSRHTGLLVDARGLNAQPALAPRLLDESGAVLYGPATLSDAARKESAPARYFKTLELASKAPALGATPLVVKAARAQGSDVLLGAAEAKAVQDLSAQVLAEGRVAIVP